jgi:photosystem II stability/assembly factor-like uncharacterized protein
MPFAMFQRQARTPFPFRNILILAALVMGLLYYAIKVRQQNNAEIPPEETEGKKEVPPEDIFFASREYPQFYPDMNAWSAAAVQVSGNLEERSPGDALNTSWTVQGPGNIGARINTIQVHPSDPDIIYIGYANGGVWKTTNGGQSWVPIFDQQPFLTIGDIELDPQNPEIVFVGTGDPNIGGYASIGDGLWKSPDGGQTWQHLGLDAQRIVSKIIINPQNSNIIYAATMGLPFQRNNDRGLYKSTNGGQTWTQSLFIDNQTGISDLVMSPSNPNVLYASSWVRIRTNSESLVSGVNSGVWKSENGGTTWTRQQGGLPTNRKSRVSLTIDPNAGNRVLAMYADSTLAFHQIYETTNAGVSWDTTLNQGLDRGFQANFAWYFGGIEINPFHSDDLWAGGVEMWRSLDRGDNWVMTTPEWWKYEVHADMHDIAFLSADEIIIATDGGLYRTYDSGGLWEKIENIPTSQFYRVAYNPFVPQAYYGGAQDNGSTAGNANDINNWFRLFGGDGFQARFHPENPNIFYFETQNGGIVGTLDSIGFENATVGIDGNDRRSWDMPYMISRHEPEFMYAGTYRIYQSVGHLPNWYPVSEDLTDGVIFGNSYHVISAIDEDYFTDGVVYAGTSDANVWRGDVNNQVWVNISNGLPERYVSSVHPSPNVNSRIFVTQTGYRDNDFSAHIHRSDNNGASWTPIGGDLPPVSINDVMVVPGRGDSVLCVATDFGVFVTLNSGGHWERLGKGMPNVRVFDLDINQAQKTLIAGTFARSIMTFPLDSLKSEQLSSVNPPLTEKQFALWPTVVQAGAAVNITTDPSFPTENSVVAIYSMEGRKISEYPLVNRSFPAPVTSPGTYFVAVKKDGRLLKAQKIVVVR